MWRGDASLAGSIPASRPMGRKPVTAKAHSAGRRKARKRHVLVPSTRRSVCGRAGVLMTGGLPDCAHCLAMLGLAVSLPTVDLRDIPRA